MGVFPLLLLVFYNLVSLTEEHWNETCFDEKDNCKQYYCKYYADETLDKCRLTCGLCVPTSTTSRVFTTALSESPPISTKTTTQSPQPPPPPAPCVDLLPAGMCANMVETNSCHQREDFGPKCRQSCGLCGSRPPPPCVDKISFEQCVDGRRIGRCGTPYFNDLCRRMCGYCGFTPLLPPVYP